MIIPINFITFFRILVILAIILCVLFMLKNLINYIKRGSKSKAICNFLCQVFKMHYKGL